MSETVYIMWKRQLKRYWRSKPRLVGSLGQPLMFLIALGLGFGPVFEKAGEGSYIDFLAPGIISMSILFTAMFNGIDVIWDRKFGFLKETLVAPISRMEIMVGKVVGGATVASVQGLIVLTLTLLVGFRPESIISIVPAFAFMLLIATLFTAFGTAIASKIEDMQAFPLIMNFVIMPLFFLSGALFPLKDLPSALNTIVRLNPLSYGVDAVRGTLTGAFTFGLEKDFIVLVAVTAIIFAIGSKLFSKVEL